MLPLLKETQLVSPHSEGSVITAGCGSAQRAAARERVGGRGGCWFPARLFELECCADKDSKEL